MEALATLAPAITKIDVLVDVRLIQIDQLTPIALGLLQQRTQVFDKRRAPLGVGAAEQLLGLLPGQLKPMQGGADGLAAAEAAKPLLHQSDQTLERPAWLRISPDDRWRGRLPLSGTDCFVEGRRDLWTKGGRPPVRRYSSASGPCSLSVCSQSITVCGRRSVRSATSVAQLPCAMSCRARNRSRLRG
jgi:hypothetical protein